MAIHTCITIGKFIRMIRITNFHFRSLCQTRAVVIKFEVFRLLVMCALSMEQVGRSGGHALPETSWNYML